MLSLTEHGEAFTEVKQRVWDSRNTQNFLMLEGQIGDEGLEREKFEPGQVLKETKKEMKIFLFSLSQYGMVRVSDEPIRGLSEEYRGNHYQAKPISVSTLTGGGEWTGCQPSASLEGPRWWFTGSGSPAVDVGPGMGCT